MCGILAAFGSKDREYVESFSQKMAHRGPDERGVKVLEDGTILCHERLSIIDLHTGKQPIQGCKNAWVIHNGEIYNHRQLREGILAGCTFHTESDSEVIVHLYEKFGTEFLHHLDGVFAFVVADGQTIIAGRDPLGVKPLYYGVDSSGTWYFASEMKALTEQCEKVEAFPPGHYYTPETGFVRYYQPAWFEAKVAQQGVDYEALRLGLEASVEKRLMSDVPIGVFLSGGLDSSLVASIMARKMKARGQELHSFSIGLTKDSPDLKAAREVAQFIGSIHHEVTFSVEEGLALIDKLVWHLESYDVTTIRASTPMYLLSEYIVKQGIKVVLSGEGADEMFGGYLYFGLAPSPFEFQLEAIRRVQLLSTADLLRADKSTMAHGLEARVPFLDKQFLDLVMHIRPEDKQPAHAEGRMEKYILRKAFDTPEQPYLPDHILWRQKEQFSDGVGYSWVDSLVAHAEATISDGAFAEAALKFPYNTPSTKEAFMGREIFEKHFPHEGAIQSVKKWIPKWQQSKDPSGRASDFHAKRDLAGKAAPQAELKPA
ncbi:MAG: asparagine synthase B [Bacteroidia bacterium]|nr:asparagine synthase B [Bacteroidia bacterium]